MAPWVFEKKWNSLCKSKSLINGIKLLGLQPELILARCKPRVTLPSVALPWADSTIGLSARS